jgi:hypothetical protein
VLRCRWSIIGCCAIGGRLLHPLRQQAARAAVLHFGVVFVVLVALAAVLDGTHFTCPAVTTGCMPLRECTCGG